jgi:hypothetical protein
MLDAQPSYSWRNKIATVLRGRETGQAFLPLPGGYKPSSTDQPRGGHVPMVTDVAVPGGVIDITERAGGSFADTTTPNFFPLMSGKDSELRRFNRERVGADARTRRFGVGF